MRSRKRLWGVTSIPPRADGNRFGLNFAKAASEDGDFGLAFPAPRCGTLRRHTRSNIMRNRWNHWMASVDRLGFDVVGGVARSAAEQPAETVAVSKTYNNAPFDYRIRLLAQRARVSRVPADVSVAGRHAARAKQHDSRRLLRPQRHSARRRQAAGGHLSAHPRRQRAADRIGLLGAGESRHSGHCVQAALLRQPRHGQGARSLGRRSQTVRRRDRPGGRRHPANDRPAGLAARGQSRADRHHGHQPGRHHRRLGRRGRAAHPSGGLDPGRRRSAADHPSRPRNPRLEPDDPEVAAGPAGRGGSEHRGGRSVEVRRRPCASGPKTAAC